MDMVPQDQFLHALQQVIDGVENLKAPEVGLGDNWVGHSGPPL